jgi:hypothetical protein
MVAGATAVEIQGILKKQGRSSEETGNPQVTGVTAVGTQDILR